jgi:plasmid stabilization system protein ParE
LRLFPVGRYLILYPQEASAIVILRILHGARDWRRLVKSGPTDE